MMILNSGCCKSTVVVLLLLVGLLVPTNVMAQVDMGSISGIVRDPSGAGIPNAKVVLTNEDTNITVSTITGSEGQYTFAPIKIGRYSVSASVTGFQTVQQTNVTVDVQQKVNLDISLVLGQATETIVVNAAPPLMQTLDASVGQVIQEAAIDDRP